MCCMRTHVHHVYQSVMTHLMLWMTYDGAGQLPECPYDDLQAGGLGSTGEGRVLDVCPEKVHQRVPLFIGSKKEVEYLESFYNKA